MRIISVVLAALMLVGCQTAQPPSTASGKAEVTIKGSVGAVKAQLLSQAMDRKFSVTKDTEYLLQVEKPSDNLGAALLLGSRYDGVPAERIVFTFAPLGETVRVVAALMFVTNPGSAYERLTPINTGPGVDRTQSTLDEVKQAMEVVPVATQKPAPRQRASRPTT